jgi:crotonobetainyl-CoA:carnitine CoA-transferase CaiB-like acyl-CoA transferase
VAALEAAEVPAGPVFDLSQVFADPQAQHLDLHQRIEHPTAGNVGVTGFPWRYSSTPAEIRYSPPLLGEHTDATLAELGYSAEEVASLHADQAV